MTKHDVRGIRGRDGLCALMISLAMLAMPARAQAVAGDCSGDGSVTVDELIIGVNIALGEAPLSSCPVFDVDGDGTVTIDELIAAVNLALSGGPAVAFVIATDFQTGSFATVSLDEPRVVTSAGAQRRVNSDAVARSYGGGIYVLNRFGAATIQVLDPAQSFAATLQCSTGPGSNPNDIAFASPTKAYVAALGSAQLLIVNPAAHADCSDFVVGHVDLSAFADADGIPEMNALAIIGDRL